MRILANSKRRCLVILSNEFALIFRDSRSQQEFAKKPDRPPKLLIEFVPEATLSQNDASGFHEVCSDSERHFYGLLGLYSNKGHIFAGFITERVEVGSATLGEKIYRIERATFVSLSGEIYDYHGSDEQQEPPISTSSTLYTIRSVQKLLASGTFYYSTDYDMTSSVQERGFQPGATHRFDSQLFEQSSRFAWNRMMVNGLVTFRNRLSKKECEAFDSGQFLLSVIRGFAQSLTTSGKTDSYMITIVSKQDCKKHGPLFGPYGMDDDGNATNFVETEFILSDKTQCFSYVVLRANVPLFWELESQLLSTRIHFPRSAEASKHAFSRHFQMLVDRYGPIHVVDALSAKGSQPELSLQYQNSLESIKDEISYMKVDASQCNKRSDFYTLGLLSYFEDAIESDEAYVCLETSYGLECRMWQAGAFLVNTLDSNDRSNFIETKICEKSIKNAFKVLSMEDDLNWPEFWEQFSVLWDANGHALGKMSDVYKNSLHTKSKRGGLVGKMANQSIKYVTPVFHNGQQAQFDRLLGRAEKQFQIEFVDPVHDFVMGELDHLRQEFVSHKQVHIYTCTYNVNAEMYDGDLTGLIFPDGYKEYDIIVIGLEEVIELSPAKIMNIDKSIRLFWEHRFKEILPQYTLIRGEQLGGMLELVFVREQDNLQHISEICASVRKTGLKGIAANKGGVAIAFEYSHTKFCFVVSHLAAGMGNVEERHQDYKTIANGLRFRQNRMMRDYDVVIWIGDFNFRIDATNDEVRSILQSVRSNSATKQRILNQLFERDQLNQQMATGQSFPFFDEKEITFVPTYKYDRGTSEFDSSEKQRIPAWCDRVVMFTRDKSILEQTSYGSIPELEFSDHKPVYGEFVANLEVVDESTRAEWEQRLYTQKKLEIDGLNSILSETPTRANLRYGLPPPSNRDSKWWEYGEAQVRIKELDDGKSLSPGKNPFVNEPTFI